MLVKQFPFGGTSVGTVKKYLMRGYRCGNCKSGNIRVLINEGGIKTYQCNGCKRIACAPRIYYKLKEEYKTDECIKKIMRELGISLHEHTLYRGKLAVLVAVFKSFLRGDGGISRNITRLEIKP